MMRKLCQSIVLLFLSAVVLFGCGKKVPEEALALTPESLQLRQLQTRRFESQNEQALLIGGAGVLQDLGFTLEESETELGVIVASKERSAVEAGQVIGSIILMAITKRSVPWDKNQKIRASLVTRPAGRDGENTLVRVTFQRIVWNTEGKISKAEPLDEPEFYQEFFARLSKAVFLDAHEL